MMNENKTYAIVDKENRIIEYFRLKESAKDMLRIIQRNHFDKLEIKKLQ